MMRLSKRYITALDIQDRHISCSYLKYSSRSWHIEKTASKEIPSPPDNVDAAHSERTAHAIRILLQEMDIYPPDNLVTCISGRDATVRLLSLPPVDDSHMKNIEEMVRYELMMALPVAIDQMSYDYQVLGRDAHRTLVLTVAAKRGVIERHLELLSMAGVSTEVVTASPLALFNAFANREPEIVRSGNTGLVYLGKTGGDMLICQDGHPVYTRSFSLHPNFSNSHLIREIHNSFDSYIKSHKINPSDSPEEIGSAKKQLEAIHLMTEDGELPPGLTVDHLSDIVSDTPWYVTTVGDNLSLGLGLSTAVKRPKPISSSLIHLNLRRQMSREERATRKNALRSRIIHISPAVIIPILILISIILWWQVWQTDKEIRFAREVSREQMAGIEQLAKQEEEQQKRITFLDWSGDDYPMVSYRLYQVARAIPDNLWLKEISIPRQKPGRKNRHNIPPSVSRLQVTGYAHQQSHIVEFLDALGKYGCFSEVVQEKTSEVRVSGERILEFQIGLISRAGSQETQLTKAGDAE